MKNLNKYILEKLKISKDLKFNNRDEIIKEIFKVTDNIIKAEDSEKLEKELSIYLEKRNFKEVEIWFNTGIGIEHVKSNIIKCNPSMVDKFTKSIFSSFNLIYKDDHYRFFGSTEDNSMEKIAAPYIYIETPNQEFIVYKVN